MDRTDLLPGDIGFAQIGGRAGRFTQYGQALLLDSCRFDHVRLIIDGHRYIEALPGGARIRELADIHFGPGHAYARMDLSEAQRMLVTPLALTLEGTKYSFMNYPALAAHRFGLSTPRLRKYIVDSNRMICSQLVDHILTEVGYHLFNDGRLPQDVTPGDLYYATDPRVL